MTSGLSALIAAVFSVFSGPAIPPPLDVLPKFAVRSLKPNENPESKQFDVGVCGSFQNVSCALLVKLTVRETDLTTQKSTETDTAPVGELVLGGGFQDGILRDVGKPQNGGFLCFVSIPRYDLAKFKYEVKVEFRSGDNLISTYKDAKKQEWVPVAEK
jgi:hypothetical protein